MVAGGGESSRTIVVGEGMGQGGRDGEEIGGEFHKHCSNVTSFSIAAVCYSWKFVSIRQLTKLEVSARGAL